ncbi:MAG: hypothetical protein JNM34_07035 [Chthonomonadaceae bacterium]|nr:hypothetical protein [Chthonomonadaceae bacterium]
MTVVRVLLSLLFLYLALAWQSSLSGQGTLLGHRPALPLMFVTLVGLRVGPRFGALYGFLAGFFEGAAAGANLSAHVLSRTLIGFTCGFVHGSDLQLRPAVVAMVATLATVLAQVSLLFMAPPPDIQSFIGATLGTAIFNGVGAGLLDILVRRTLDPKVD